MYLLEGIFTMKAIRNRCWRICGNNTGSEWHEEPGAIIRHAGMLRRAQHRSVAGLVGNCQSYADCAICNGPILKTIKGGAKSENVEINPQ
jgi:hypothetical protein